MKKKVLERLHFSPITFGEKAADKLSSWAGSWLFIISFFVFLVIWMMTSGFFILRFVGDGSLGDAYPFILLNLVLSCLAAIQAPVILMSQNRQSKKDRQRFDYDYLVNRRSERKIGEIQTQLSRIEKRIGIRVMKKDLK